MDSTPLSASEHTGLASRVCAITGGSSGIGRATALALARLGAHVAVIDCDLAGAQATAAQAQTLGVKAVAIGCDTSGEAAVSAAAANLSNLHVDFNARNGVHAREQSTVSLEAVQLVNNGEKGLLLSPRSRGSATEKEVVAKDVWWPSPNCGPKELYVD